MVREYLQSRPLMRITIMMTIGIIIGRMTDIPFLLPYHYGVAAIALMVVTALLWRYERTASVLAVALMLFTGVYLIKQHDAVSPPRKYARQAAKETCLTPIRDRIFNEYTELGLDGDVLAITTAMTLGDKHLVTKETKETYAITGASHIFALSGLHLGIIFMIMSLLCRPLKAISLLFYDTSPRLFRALSITIELLPLPLIWFFSIMVGAHASVMRAAAMITVYAFCRLLARKTSGFEVLCLTAFILLTVNPQWLFDIGFQLSFLAVAGISTLYTPLYRIVPHKTPRLLKYLWGLFCVSLTAQIATTPIIAYYFGRIPLFGLMTNYIVSPMAFVIIIGTLLLLITHWAFIAHLLTTTIEWQTSLLQQIADMPNACITDIRPTAIQTVLIYIIIVCSATIILKLRHAKGKGR